MINRRIFSFWYWFFFGSGGKPGFRRIINFWIIFHIIIGLVLACIVKIDLISCARTVILPLASIFVGLSFAWIGNAYAFLQTEKMEMIAKYHAGGFIEYAYTFQTAILTILISLVLWGICGLEVFDKTWPTPSNCITYFIIKIVLFTISSLALRECWHVVLAVQWILIAQNELKKNI
jgi:hypothetical protein